MRIFISNKLNSYYSIVEFLFFTALVTNISFAQSVEHKKETIKTDKEVIFGAGVSKVDVSLWGGGAGGNAGGFKLNGNQNSRQSGSGGGASSWAGKTITVNPDKKYSVIIGKGGAKGVYNSSNDTASEGGDGTASSFGDYANFLVKAGGGYSFKNRNSGNFSGGEAGKNILPSYDCSGRNWPQITGLEVQTKTDRFVSINWDNLPGAVSYIVIYKPTSSVETSFLIQETSVSSIIISDLMDNTEYEFQIIGKHQYGDYNPNFISSSFKTLLALESISHFPSEIHYSNVTTNSVVIAGQLGSFSSDFEYTMEYKSRSSTVWTIMPEATINNLYFSKNISGLQPNTKYDCRISSDKWGGGAIYWYTEFKTLSGSSSIGLPQNPMVYGLESESALLTWDHVNGADGYEITIAIEGQLIGYIARIPKGQNWYFEKDWIRPNLRTSFSIKASNATISGSTYAYVKGLNYCYPYAEEGSSGLGLMGGDGGLANQSKYGHSGDPSKQYGSKGYGTQNLPRDNSGYGPGQSPIEIYAKVYGGFPTQNAINPGDGGGGGGMEIINYGRLFQIGLLSISPIFKAGLKQIFVKAVNSVDMTSGDEFRYGTDGGTGADGVVNLYYTCPIYKFTSPPVTSRICGNSGSSTITVFSRNMPDGKYVITYNSSSPFFLGKTAEMYFENGSGNFPTATVQDNSLITITSISSGTTCNNVVNDYNTVRTIVKNSSLTEINTSVEENICIGQTITVPYFIGCKTFNAGNQFSLELSQSDGSFATPVILKTVSGTRSGEIVAEIPNYVVAGTQYRVRVNGTSPATLGNDNGRDIIIGEKAGSISLSSSTIGNICQGTSINLYATASALVQDTTRHIALLENFNGSINAWRKINESIGGTPENAAWNIKPDNYKHYYNGYADKNIQFSDRTSFMYVSSNLQSNTTTGSKGITRSTLESPVFSTAGMATAKLSLNTAYLYAGNITEAYSAIRIEISKNGTDWAKLYERRNQYQNSWTTSTSLLNDWNSGLYKPILLEIPLDDYVNESQLRVRFVYETEFRSSSLSFWAIDDVKIHTEFIPDRITWSSEPVGFSSNLLNPDAFVPTETTSYSVVRMNEFGCTSTEQIAVSVNESSASFTDLSVCSSELPYTWNGLVFKGAGVQTVQLVNGVGCDSLATLNLGINDSYSFQSVSICSSALPYTWNGLTFTKTESQTAHLINAFGCDSSATLSLKVLDTGSTTNKSICSADFPFVWNGITITAPGTQTATFTNSVGCDSIATLNLSLSSEDVIVKANYVTACQGTQISLLPVLKNDSAKLLLEGFNNLSNNWKSRNLNILDTDVKGAWMMSPDNYVFREIRTYQSNDRSQFYLSNAYDAATGVETNVGLESPEFSTQGYTASELRFFHTFEGGAYDSIKVEISRNSGVTWQSIYTYSNKTGSSIGDIGQSDRFIEKVIPLSGYLNEDGLKIRFVHKADGYGGRWAIDNVKITGAVDMVYNWSSFPVGFSSNVKDPRFTMGSENTEVFLTVTNIDGCQSTNSLQLISQEGAITSSNTTETICSSELPYTWNGLTFVADGTQTAILKNNVGCDSLATLILSVNASSTSLANIVACNEYVWNATTYTESGIYTFETQNAIGCDSIATLNLVLNSNTSETNLSICSSELSTFTWNGLSFTESSTKSIVLTNALGCDSTAFINLSVSPLVEVSTSDTIICAGNLINLTADLTDGASLVLLEEAFNAPLTDWTITNNSTSNAGWKFYDAAGYQGRVSSDYSQFIGVNTIIESGSNLTSTNLTSPAIDASAYKTLKLNFEQDFLYQGATIKIEASDNNGASWSTVYTKSSILVFSTTEVNLDSYAGKPNVKIRFKFHETGFKGWWFIDNVKFTGLLKQKFTWTSNTGNFTSTEQNPEITDLQESTMFTVLAENTEGCITVDSVFVKVNPTSNSQVTLFLCPESFPYVWEEQTFTEAGSKTITLTNIFGCDSVATLTINESPVPLNVYTTGDNSILCGTDSISLSSSSNPSLAVNILTQNFEGEPTGMITENLSTGSLTENSSWTVVTNGYSIGSYTLHSPDASSFYLSNSDAQSGGTTHTLLTSQPFSTIGFDSVNLSFDHYYRALNPTDSIIVEVSLNEGLQWDKVLVKKSSVGTENSFKAEKVKLNDYLNEPRLMVRFRFKANAGGWWAMDKLSINGFLIESQYAWSIAGGDVFSALQNPIEKVFPLETTTYSVNVTNSLGCSVSKSFELTVNNSTDTLRKSICASEYPYTWAGLEFLEEGIQTAHLTRLNGCDSTVVLELKTLYVPLSTTTVTLCENLLPFVWNGQSFTAEGVYTVVLNSHQGCDSTAVLNLKINPIPSSLLATASDIQICNGNSVSLSGSNVPLTENSILTENFNNANVLWISTNQSIGGNFTSANWERQQEAYDYKSTVFGSNDNSVFYLSNSDSQGAGSNTLSYLESPAFSTVGYSDASLSFYQHFKQLTNKDTISIEITKDNGVNWDLIYQHHTSNIGSANAFENKVLALTDFKDESSVKLRFVYKASFGQHWAIDNIEISGTTLGENYQWRSIPIGYTSSALSPSAQISLIETTDYFLKATNGLGCVAEKKITVEVLTEVSNIDLTICSSELPYLWKGLTFNAAGSQTAHIVDNGGCVSDATLNLTVLNTSSSITNTTICENELPYNWNGLVLTRSGSSLVSLTNAQGCDSLATLNLKVNSLPFDVLASSSVSEINLGGSVVLTSSANSKIINETFNLPLENWVNVNDGTGAETSKADWTIKESGVDNITSPDGSPYIVSNPVNVFGYLTDVKLESPIFSTIGYDNLSLEFNHTFFARTTSGEFIKVQVTKDNGSNWTDVYTATTDVGASNQFVHTSIPLNAFLNEAQLKFRFYYKVNGGYHWALDNVTLKGTNDQNLNYSWTSEPTGFTSSTQNPGAVSPVEDIDYIVAISNGLACVTSDRVSIKVNKPTSSVNDLSICAGELPYTWNGLTFTEAGTQFATLTNAAGSDSTATLNLTVLDVLYSYTTEVICPSELPFLWNGLSINLAGSHSVNLTSSNGCDSIAILALTINPIVASLTAGIDNNVLCLGESANLWATASSENSSILLEENFDANTHNWTVLNNNTGGDIYLSPWIRRLDGYFESNETYHSPSNSPFFMTSAILQGSRPHVTNTSLVSPSFNTIGMKEADLSFNYFYFGYGWENEKMSIEVSIDGGSTWSILDSKNQWQYLGDVDAFINQSNSMNAYLDESDVKLKFTFYSSSSSWAYGKWGIDDISISGIAELEHTYSWASVPASFGSIEQNPNNIYPNKSGDYVVTATNSMGCSATQSISVSVNTPSNDKTIKELCSSELPFTWNGTEYSNSGIYTYSYDNGSSCASVDTLDLIINQSTNVTEIASTCTSYNWHGVNYTTSGEYLFSYTNAKGCASVETLKLAVAANNIIIQQDIDAAFEHIRSTNTISSDKKIGKLGLSPNSNVIFEADQSILLLPGFGTLNNSQFKAEIKKCL